MSKIEKAFAVVIGVVSLVFSVCLFALSYFGKPLSPQLVHSCLACLFGSMAYIMLRTAVKG